MKYLFRKELRDAVEDKYGEFRVYEALRIPCIAQMNESEEFALHPSDLFYHTLFTIDEIKQWSRVDAKKYISNALWDDLYSCFRENGGVYSKDDLNKAVAEVMYSVAMLLTWSDSLTYIPLAGTLIYQIEMHLPGYTDEVHKKFDDSFDMQDADAFRKYLADYLVISEMFCKFALKLQTLKHCDYVGKNAIYILSAVCLLQYDIWHYSLCFSLR